MLHHRSLISLFSFALIFVDAYGAPRPCTGFCNARDPALIRRSDGTYFRFSTGSRISIATAPSLSGPWAPRGSAIRGGSAKINKKGNQDLWVRYLSISNTESKLIDKGARCY
jgi:arabinan endo-1,5-alpha-L-arabinosidase